MLRSLVSRRIRYPCISSSFHSSSILLSKNESTATNNNKDSEGKKNMMTNSILPGIALSVATACVGFTLAKYSGEGLLALQGVSGGKSPISGIPVSILLGLSFRNYIFPYINATPKAFEQFEKGAKYCTTTILRAGIVCVGFKLSGADVASNLSIALPAVTASISLGIMSGIYFSKLADVPIKMGCLIAAGSSICGVTAITALAPIIKASERDVAFSIGTVVAFGTSAMLVYPYLAHAFFENPQAIGLFLGCAIHDTSQVIGSALTYVQVYGEEEVLKTAAITKLTRNLALAFVIPSLAVYCARAEGGETVVKEKINFQSFAKYFPGFVGGFIAMASLRTMGDYAMLYNNNEISLLSLTIDGSSWKYLTHLIGDDIGSNYLLGTAMAGVGLSTNASSLKGVGVKPFIVGGASALMVGVSGFTMANLLI